MPRYSIHSSVDRLPPITSDLSTEYFGARIPTQEEFRPHFGRSLDLNTIDSAIRSANHGQMRRITDLSRETITLDTHLSALLQKRLNRVATLDWNIEPASGSGIDDKKATGYADVVREQLEMIPRFRDSLVDLTWGNFDGRACSEIEWRARGPMWAVQSLCWIHPRRLSFGRDRDIRVIDSNRESTGFRDEGFPVEKVPNKFVVFKPRLFGDYQEREGLALRTLYWSFFMRFGTRERLQLMEIFGKPWRLLMPKTPANGQAGWNDITLQSGYDSLNALGYHNTARLPPDVDVQVVQPAKGAGDVHKEVIEHAQMNMSKLVLGQTATTDAVSSGIGSGTDVVHLSEEDLIVAGDARRLSEAVQDQLTNAIIEVNFGPGEVTHAPTFTIRTDPPRDRKTEGELLQMALDVGLEVGVDEAREKLSVTKPPEGEPFIKKTPRNLNGAVPPYLPQPETHWPKGKAPPQAEIIDIPFIEGTFPVGQRPPPIDPNQLPGGPPAPSAPDTGTIPELVAAPDAVELDADDEPTEPEGPTVDEAVEALAAKMTEHKVTECTHGKKNRCPLCGIERVRDFDMGEDGAVEWTVAWRPIAKAAPAPVPTAVAASSKDPETRTSTERVVIVGGPRRGKSTRARSLGLPIFCTDPRSLCKNPEPGVTYLPEKFAGMKVWSKAHGFMARNWLSQPGPWVLEGVQAAAVLRNWLKANEGQPLPFDKVLVFKDAHPDAEVSAAQEAMAKGINDTTWPAVSEQLKEVTEYVTHAKR